MTSCITSDNPLNTPHGFRLLRCQATSRCTTDPAPQVVASDEVTCAPCRTIRSSRRSHPSAHHAAASERSSRKRRSRAQAARSCGTVPGAIIAGRSRAIRWRPSLGLVLFHFPGSVTRPAVESGHGLPALDDVLAADEADLSAMRTWSAIRHGSTDSSARGAPQANRRVRLLPSRTGVAVERRDYHRRSDAQCRVVECVCCHPEGATCDETAAAARIPATGAHRVLRRLATKHLVRCEEGSRWRADAVLMSPPALCRVEPTYERGGWE